MRDLHRLIIGKSTRNRFAIRSGLHDAATLKRRLSPAGWPDVTVLADAGMISGANQEGDRGGRAVVHPRHAIPRVPYVVAQRRCEHPGEQIPDGQLWPDWPASKRRDQVIYYQYRHDQARRTLHGIDEQVTKEA